jgi:hypothetical protein
VITFKYDLPQFYLLLLSIKKYLKKDIHIKIVFNYSNQDEYESFPIFDNLINTHLLEYSFEIIKKPSHIIAPSGWVSQQILKWLMAYESNRPWQIVLDSKNFFIREFDFSVINYENNIIPGFEFDEKTDVWSSENLKVSRDFIKQYKESEPQPYMALTPWIWKTEAVREMLDTCWPDRQWEMLEVLPGTEWFLYLSWVHDLVKYYPKQVVTGIWGIRNNGAKEVKGLLNNKDICFWVNHRVANNSIETNFTKNVLKTFSVCNDDEIKYWLNLKTLKVFNYKK